MRMPLDEFANRLARNPDELREFIQGLVNEKHVDRDEIIRAVEDAAGERAGMGLHPELWRP